MAERKIKPLWSMDVMILSNINDISKAASETGILVESGDYTKIFELRAILKELYYNLESFIDKDGKETIEEIFKKVDEKLDFENKNINVANYDELLKVVNALNLVRRLLFQIRNEMFMRFVTVLSAKEKAMIYSFGRLPDKEEEK